MILYISIITLFSIILSAINIVFNFMAISAGKVMLLVLGGVICEFAIDGLIAGLIHFFPNKWFKVENKFYIPSDGERKFYEKIKIRKWKDHVWELGSLGGFSKKELKSSSDIEYIKRFIIESNKGTLVHILGCIAGFALIAIYLPFNCLWQISLPISIVNIFFNLPSLFILRYNTPKLHAGYKRLLRNQNKTAGNTVNTITENESNSNTASQNETSSISVTEFTPEIQLENSAYTTKQD